MQFKADENDISKKDVEISEERENELIKKMQNKIRKGFVTYYQILRMGKTDEELNYIYNWLDENDIEIRGEDGIINSENFNYVSNYKMARNFIPKTLDDEEQEKLFLKLHNFSSEDKANNIPEYQKVRNQLIESNMKLAKWVTGWENIAKIDLPTKDKYQIAYWGLIEAVDKFNPTRGYKFSTYATRSIFRKIIRETYKGEEIKRDSSVDEQLEMMKEIKDDFLISLGREAKPYEIADKLGISLKKFQQLENFQNLKEKESLEQIESDTQNLERLFEQFSDGDKGIRADNEYIIDGVYIDEKELLPVGFRKEDIVNDKIITKMIKEDLKEVLLMLPEIEREVLTKRFGLESGIFRSLADIGKDYNTASEQIRLIEKRALEKLRNLPKIKGMIDSR